MTIGPFRDEYRWISNFWEVPILIDDKTYNSNEHFYQSCKTVIPDEISALLDVKTPGQAKRMGNTITLRDDWVDIRVDVMRYVTIIKYRQHMSLYCKLKSTYPDDIIEYNTWHDNFWGECTCDDCTDVIGENNFGKILMLVRDMSLEEMDDEPVLSI